MSKVASSQLSINGDQESENKYVEDLISQGVLKDSLRITINTVSENGEYLVRVLKIKKIVPKYIVSKVNRLYYKFTLETVSTHDDNIDQYLIHGIYEYKQNKTKSKIYTFEQTNFTIDLSYFFRKYKIFSNTSSRVSKFNLYINTNKDLIKDHPVSIKLSSCSYNSYYIIYEDPAYNIIFSYLWVPDENVIYVEHISAGFKNRSPLIILEYFKKKPLCRGQW